MWPSDRSDWTYGGGGVVPELQRKAPGRTVLAVRSVGAGGRAALRAAGVFAVLAARAARPAALLGMRADDEGHEEQPAGPGLLHLPPQDRSPRALLDVRQGRAGRRPHRGRSVVRTMPPDASGRALLTMRPDGAGHRPRRRETAGVPAVLAARASTAAAPVHRLRRGQACGSAHRGRATVREVRQPACAGGAVPALREDPQGRDSEHGGLPGLRPASWATPAVPQLRPDQVGGLPRRRRRTVVRRLPPPDAGRTVLGLRRPQGGVRA
ncbi:hypothetical protein FHX69_7213 [Prauserella muralis]|nr:hypothetical protein FHX69_7213 [Prauserella muralis]